MMPGELLGFDVLAELRKDRMTALIPFVFLTARTDRIDQRHGMNLGADDYLTKPFKIGELLAAIQTRLQKHDDMIAKSEEKLETLRENITTSLPHELRTPLNTIIGFSDMMMTDAQNLQPQQLTDWAQMIHSAGMRLYRLIENYLTYARIEAFSRKVQKMNINGNFTANPADIIHFQAMEKAQHHRREADIVLNVNDAPKVNIPEDELKKIIDELVDNAFKFSEPGTRVHIESRMNGQIYAISIRDEGRGMTPEQINTVGAFMQFDRWLYEQQGMGLGLTIARRLVEIYGGDLNIESAPKEGTVVTVLLPAN
jgi:signal transduction histidine kinase